MGKETINILSIDVKKLIDMLNAAFLEVLRKIKF
jgi:hypothetical protein